MAVNTYDPAKLTITVAGKKVTGFAAGTLIKVSKNADAFTMNIGGTGEGGRVASTDESGSIEITLMQQSSMNDFFSAIAAADKATGAGIVPIAAIDLRVRQ